MKFNNLAMGFGIVFGIGMLPLAYFNLALGLALAFSGAGDFSIMIYVFALLGVAIIIASLFARKCIWIARVVNSISLVVLLATIIYLTLKQLLFNSVLLALIYLGVLALGIFATVFAWTAKPRSKEEVFSN